MDDLNLDDITAEEFDERIAKLKDHLEKSGVYERLTLGLITYEEKHLLGKLESYEWLRKDFPE
ncbi:MAG: hypothetical protein Q4P66_09975 [Actinomycetaceae bacterium]|nr:hypothetical protein [Actinomycetaceae bacterium]